MRLLVLVALLLMPFGMAPAPAAPAVQHHPAASIPADHCPEQDQDDRDGTVADCAMPCSTALPAADHSPVDSRLARRVPVVLAVERALSGIELEIETPPPKLS